MKFASWNVNGLRSAITKGFADVVADVDADCFCVQETKLQEGQICLDIPGYKAWWSHAEKKGYSGVATLCRREPVAVTEGLGSPGHDAEGRCLIAELEKCFLINVYSPNSQDGLRRIGFRLDWEDRLLDTMKRLDAVKPVVLCGDLNVAHTDMDLRHPELHRGTTGFSDEERGALQRMLDAGFVDAWRYLHPDTEKVYSWWSYRQLARRRNDGWRIDYFIVSRRLAPQLVSADILTKVPGSDHCPVTLTVEGL